MHDKTHDKTYIIARSGTLGLRFRGRRIGEGHEGTGGTSGYSCDWDRGRIVRIYACAGAGYVLATTSWSRWQGEDGPIAAQVCATPAALLGALRDEDGLIGAAEMAAWEDACDEDPALEALRYEEMAI